MSFLDLASSRYSVRNYKNTPVPQEKINKCIEAARLAPSACNSQPWKFVIIDNPDIRESLAKAAFEGLLDFNHFAYKAPVLSLIVSERQTAFAKFGSIVKRKNFSQMDVGITAEHFCLQATEEGLGTCMLGWYNEKPIQKLLHIPRNRRIGLLISLGYEPEGYKQRQKIRKKIDKVVSYNKY